MTAPLQTLSFTAKYDGLSNVLRCNVKVSLPETPTTETKLHDFVAIWDTGATKSVITEKVAQALNLTPISIREVGTAGGKFLKNVYLVNIYLPNNVAFQFVEVTEMEAITGDYDLLIGMDIIATGDFAITNYQGKTVFSFRWPSSTVIDFVEESKEIETLKAPPKVGRNDPCPCGSGKKYKNCHGR